MKSIGEISFPFISRKALVTLSKAYSFDIPARLIVALGELPNVITGSLVEEIREALHKRVDILDVNQLKNNIELTEEILKDGVKIYG